jgi:tRNA pseudouridine38-40 synthase
MIQYKLVISYDGTDYCGWQQQPHNRTIATTIEKTFKRAFASECRMVGVSRTDTGVHALGQVALLRTNLSLDPVILHTVLNNSLPGDIHVRSCVIAPDGFYVHMPVAYKIYHYHFFIDRPLPMLRRFGWYLQRQICVQTLEKALNLFIGKHDFRSFVTDDQNKNTVRCIDRITLRYIKRYNMYRITFIGQSFLHHMVRRIVGASIDCATTKRNVCLAQLHDILEQKNPNQALTNAPASGLVLYKIVYR